jgi:hypothetical protein
VRYLDEKNKVFVIFIVASKLFPIGLYHFVLLSATSVLKCLFHHKLPNRIVFPNSLCQSNWWKVLFQYNFTLMIIIRVSPSQFEHHFNLFFSEWSAICSLHWTLRLFSYWFLGVHHILRILTLMVIIVTFSHVFIYLLVLFLHVNVSMLQS